MGVNGINEGDRKEAREVRAIFKKKEQLERGPLVELGVGAGPIGVTERRPMRLEFRG